jgi:hypothetical protein
VSANGRKVFYLIRRAAKRSFYVGELWAVDLDSGRNERVLPDVLVGSYHVSNDGRYVVFDTFDDADRSRLWVAALDRSEGPVRLTPDGPYEEQRPFFGTSGDIFFMREEPGDRRFIYRMKRDGSNRKKLSGPITFLVNVSPDEKWAAVWLWDGHDQTQLLSLENGTAKNFCGCPAGPIFGDSPRVSWSKDMQWIVIGLGDSGPRRNGGAVVFPWRGADTISRQPITSTELANLDDAQRILESSISLGPSLAAYAFSRQAEQSNLYRVRLP